MLLKSRRSILAALTVLPLAPGALGAAVSTNELRAAIQDYARHRRIWIETWNAYEDLPAGYTEANCAASARLTAAMDAAGFEKQQRTAIYCLIADMTPRYTRGFMDDRSV
jgi:hypothetical protein